MTPQTPIRPDGNSAKANLVISLIFHVILMALMFFAAREGMLGKNFQKLTVVLVKEPPPEKPKEVEKPKPVDVPKIPETPKAETAKIAETPKEAAPAPPPAMAVSAPPAFAPPAAEVPSLVFDGGAAVQTSSDPVQLYKGFVESALRSKWRRPERMDDDNFVAEVEVSVDSDGKIGAPAWKKGSGNATWDNSVRQALLAVNHLDRRPPASFPARVVLRFDVQETDEPFAQATQ